MCDNSKKFLEKSTLSFGGCGFMGIYHVGVAECVQRYARDLVSPDKIICGTSAGAMIAVSLKIGLPLKICRLGTLNFAEEARSYTFGPLNPRFAVLDSFLGGLASVLPPDAYRRCSGKVRISVTQFPDNTNRIIDQFASNDELIAAMACSAFIPLYCGFVPPYFQGKRCLDGCFSVNFPTVDEHTVCVSPFAGDSENDSQMFISPRDTDNDAITYVDYRFGAGPQWWHRLRRWRTMFSFGGGDNGGGSSMWPSSDSDGAQQAPTEGGGSLWDELCGVLRFASSPWSPFAEHSLNVKTTPFQLTLLNVRRLSYVLYPPDRPTMMKIFARGYLDAFNFLRRQGVIPAGEVPHVPGTESSALPATVPAVGLLARGRAASFLDLLQLEIEAERLAGRPTDNIELYLPRRAPPPEPPAYTEREREPERRERHEPPRAAAARALEFNPLAILSSSAAQTLYIGQMLLRAPIIPAKQIALLVRQAMCSMLRLLLDRVLPLETSKLLLRVACEFGYESFECVVACVLYGRSSEKTSVDTEKRKKKASVRAIESRASIRANTGTPSSDQNAKENAAADHSRALEQQSAGVGGGGGALELVLSASFEHQTVALSRPASSRSDAENHAVLQPQPERGGITRKRVKSGHLQGQGHITPRPANLDAATAWVERQREHRDEPSAPLVLSATQLSFSCCEIAALDADASPAEGALTLPPVRHPRSRSVPRRTSRVATADLLNGATPLVADSAANRSSKVLFLL